MSDFSGIDRTHRDLIQNNIHGCDGPNCNGPYYKDNESHGTHVSGTIGALGGNDKDVVGVIPKGTNFFAYNLFALGAATTADSVMALLTCEDWLVRKKKEDPTARMVINMSYGSSDVSSVERSTAERLYQRGDIIMVASAGNEQLETPGSYLYPASKDEIPLSYDHACIHSPWLVITKVLDFRLKSDLCFLVFPIYLFYLVLLQLMRQLFPWVRSNAPVKLLLSLHKMIKLRLLVQALPLCPL